MGGLNDILVQLNKCIHYCKSSNRILLIDLYNNTYRINFSDYIDLSNIIDNKKYISDINIIKSLDFNNSTTFYPRCINFNHFKDIIDGKIKSQWINGGHIDLNNKHYLLPSINVSNDVIVYIQCGGGYGFDIFKNINIKPLLKDYCKLKYSQMPKNYISIQVRNTDLKCDYKSILKNHYNLLKTNNVYLATDSLEVLNYFRDNGIDVINFCHFPDKKYSNLHSSNIEPETKFYDLFTDIVILAMSQKIISVSRGGFINLVKSCFHNKNIIKKMFGI